MGPTWVLSAPGGPHIGFMNLAIWDRMDTITVWYSRLGPPCAGCCSIAATNPGILVEYQAFSSQPLELWLNHGWTINQVITSCILTSNISVTRRKNLGAWALIQYKLSSYQYRKSHCGIKTVVRSSYLHNGIPYTGKMSSLYWIGALGDL